MSRKIVVLLLFAGLVLGCTRDDICPEDTPTTPLLVIRFFDFLNTGETKPVPGLRIVDAQDSEIELFATTSSTDSIAIPMRNFSTLTQYNFILNGDSEDEDEINVDEFNVNYATRDVYLNRACGFITNYDDLSPQIVDEEGGNWIISFLLLTPSVENQDETHIVIFH